MGAVPDIGVGKGPGVADADEVVAFDFGHQVAHHHADQAGDQHHKLAHLNFAGAEAFGNDHSGKNITRHHHNKGEGLVIFHKTLVVFVAGVDEGQHGEQHRKNRRQAGDQPDVVLFGIAQHRSVEVPPHGDLFGQKGIGDGGNDQGQHRKRPYHQGFAAAFGHPSFPPLSAVIHPKISSRTDMFSS